MNAIPTTTVAVLRGSTTNDLGDTVPGDTQVATGIPASIIQQRRLVTTPDDPQPRAVYFYTGRLPADTALEDGDRLLDESTGDIYVVDDHSRVANPVTTNDIRLDLRRVT